MHRPQFARFLTLSLIALTAACSDDKGSDGAPDAGGSGDTATDANGSGSGDTATEGSGSGEGSGLIDSDLRTAPDYRLSAAATVKRDAQGMAHVYGANLNDAVFAQGYEQARDRMFHLAYLRHFMYGERARYYGAAFLNDDRVKRAVRLRAVAEGNAQYYKDNQPELTAILKAFAAGVNAGLEDMKRGANGMVRPAEFDRIDPAWWPEPWTVVDSVAIAKATVFSQSFQPDIELAVFAGETLLGARKFHELLTFTPMFASNILEPSPTPESALSVGGEAAGSGSLEEQGDPLLTPEERAQLAYALSGAAQIIAESTGRPRVGNVGGSNSWAIAGAHTASGGAILCNDTHMSLEQPSRLYPTHIVDLSQNTTGALGYIAPGAPLVLIGNTSEVAWGLTNAFGDVGDLYREVFDATKTTYRYEGEQRPIIFTEEVIYVRPEGGALADAVPQTVTVRRIPGHGPLLNDLLPDELSRILSNLNIFLSIRWAGFETDTPDLVTFRLFLQSAGLTDQVEALRHFRTGAMNWTLADKSGRVGYVPAGPWPIRQQSVLVKPPYLPLAGDGGDEWQGFTPYDEIPKLIDPAKGYVVTANNSINEGPLDNLPETAPFYFGHFFDLGSRAHRITEVIEEWKLTGGITTDLNRALQADNGSIVAPLYLERLSALEPQLCADATSDRCKAIRLLQGWDRNQGVESAATSVFNVWMVHFLFETFRDDVVDPLFGLVAKDLDNVGLRATANWLAGRTPPSGANFFNDSRTRDIQEGFDEIALRALDQAIVQLRDHFGANSDPASWAWGDIHQTQHKHVVYADLNTVAAPQDSSFRAVNPTDFPFVTEGQPSPFPYLQDEGAQIRYCVDMGGASPKVFGSLNGGVSAHSGTPRFGDQIPGWLREETYAVPFTQAEVEAAATETTTLPAGYPTP